MLRGPVEEHSNQQVVEITLYMSGESVFWLQPHDVCELDVTWEPPYPALFLGVQMQLCRGREKLSQCACD